MTVCRERVDSVPARVHRERPQPLDGIHHEETSVAAANRTQRFQIRAIAAQILHEADGHEARPTACGVNFLQRIEHREPLNLDAIRFESLPRVVIRGKFFLEGDDLVARAPVEPHRNRGDAFRRIFH